METKYFSIESLSSWLYRLCDLYLEEFIRVRFKEFIRIGFYVVHIISLILRKSRGFM